MATHRPSLQKCALIGREMRAERTKTRLEAKCTKWQMGSKTFGAISQRGMIARGCRAGAKGLAVYPSSVPSGVGNGRAVREKSGC